MTTTRDETFDQWERRMKAIPGFVYINVDRLTHEFIAIGDLPKVCTCLGTWPPKKEEAKK